MKRIARCSIPLLFSKSGYFRGCSLGVRISLPGTQQLTRASSRFSAGLYYSSKRGPGATVIRKYETNCTMFDTPALLKKWVFSRMQPGGPKIATAHTAAHQGIVEIFCGALLFFKEGAGGYCDPQI